MQVTLDFDDNLYHDLVQKVGKDNLSQFVQMVLRPQLYIQNFINKPIIDEKLVNGLTLAERQTRLKALAGSWQGDFPTLEPLMANERMDLL